MAITLNSTLQAAQDSASHRMIAEIISKPMVPDIPFVGQYLTNEITDEQRPNCIMNSSNRILLIYKFDTNKFKFVYTDTDRTVFSFITLEGTDLGFDQILEITLEATICELTNGNIGMIFTTESDNYIYLRRATLTEFGEVLSYGLIETFDKSQVYNLISPYVIKLSNNTYLLNYIKSHIIYPQSSGTYTGSSNSEYTIVITSDGDETTAKFKWQKDGGDWSEEITCTGGAPQLLSDGVYINFVEGNYYEGMLFRISVIAAVSAVGYITIIENMADGDQVTIGSRTYTFKTVLGGANTVAIDIYGMEITLENLRCAITDSDFEGTGEGVRYGVGTTEHPSVTDERAEYSLKITAKVQGEAGNSISISVPEGKMTICEMSGGAESITGEVQTIESSLIMKRTSSDFSAWSAEIEIRPGNIVAHKKLHVSSLQLSNGDIWLLFDDFDDWTWANCHYSVSSDNGVSWGNATALTEYDSAQAKGLHPMLVQKSLTEAWAIYYEERGALHIGAESAGWPGGVSSITNVHVHNDKIYAVASYTEGMKVLHAVLEIDIETWRITRSWTTTSNPGFHSVFASEHTWPMNNRGDGKYVVVSSLDYPVIAVLDVEENTIRHYNFFDWPSYAITKNVNWPKPEGTSDGLWKLGGVCVDETNDLLYFVLGYQYAFTPKLCIGCIDLTDPYVPGSTWNIYTMYFNEDGYSEAELINIKEGDFKIFPESNIAILTSCGIPPSLYWQGFLTIFIMGGDTWGATKYQGGLGMSSIPYHGIKKCFYYNGVIYGSFNYDSLNQPSKKGLCRISGGVTYLEPVWPVQYDDYKLNDICLTDDGMLIITTEGYGITIYNIGTNSWTLYNNSNVLGLTPDGGNIFAPVTYDAESGLVITGCPWDPFTSWEGVVAFNRYGTLKLSKYKIGELTDVWTFGEESAFITGILDYEAVICLDPLDNGLYAFWSNQNITQNEISIKWAKETPEFNLTPYVVRKTPISLEWDIETDKPNKISFEVSHGHLFDPFNDRSLWRNYVAKGHKLTIRIGEKVNGIDYWQDQGAFLITDRSMITYERGKYPTMEIKGEDKRINWTDNEIPVSDYYETTGELILASILENEADEAIDDIDIPDFDNSTTLYHQWIEKTVMEVVKQICDRYGYFCKITVDDKITCGKISGSNDVTHSYTNLDTVITYTPDDSYSDYTTAVIVKCEGRQFEEVVFPKERVLFVTGTIGWWGQKKETKEYYSENREKKVRNPEIKVLESTASIMFELAGKVREYISEEDPDDKYLVVKIEAPDLRPALAACIAGYAGSSAWSGTFWGEAGKTAALITALSILGSICNYQFEIWGNPVGQVRRSWQSEPAEDMDFRDLIGKDVVKTLDEPLAYYINEAQAVADHEMFVISSQRRRVKISKIGHLQDEAGDTIRVIHPYSGSTKKIFITNLKRDLKLSESPEGSGYFMDNIDGWLFEQ